MLIKIEVNFKLPIIGFLLILKRGGLLRVWHLYVVFLLTAKIRLFCKRGNELREKWRLKWIKRESVTYCL